jgi:hypothetical protein
MSEINKINESESDDKAHTILDNSETMRDDKKISRSENAPQMHLPNVTEENNYTVNLVDTDSDSSYDSDVLTLKEAKEIIKEKRKNSEQCKRRLRKIGLNYDELHQARLARKKTESEKKCSSNNCNLHEHKNLDKNYVSFRARLKSFDTWPIGLSQTDLKLASSGFVYSGK